MRTLADMKTAGMTLLEMLDSARDDIHMPITLESLCAEAATEIRKSDLEIEKYRDELGRLLSVVGEEDYAVISGVLDGDGPSDGN